MIFNKSNCIKRSLFYVRFIAIVCSIVLSSCSSGHNVIEEIDSPEVSLKMTILADSYISANTDEGIPQTKAIADEIKYISLLLFDTNTGLYNRQISFDVVGSNYMFNIPIGNWTFVFIGTGDGLIADFAAPLQPGVTQLSDVMVNIAQDSFSNYTTTREYFYAKSSAIITTLSTALPTVTMVRVVSKVIIKTSKQLADSLSYVGITINNVSPSYTYSGIASTSYVNQNQSATTPNSSGIYSFTFYSFGSKPLGTTASDYNLIMDYVRISDGISRSFQMDNAGDFQPGGMIVNTQTTLNIGI